MMATDSRFMVMGLTGIVLRDVVGTIKASFPTLAESVAGTEQDALNILTGSKHWKFAFLNLGPDEFVASELAKMFEALGTKIILMGNAAEDAALHSAYPVLIRPFATDDILRILEPTP